MTREEHADLLEKLAMHRRNIIAFTKMKRMLLAEFCMQQAMDVAKRLNEEPIDGVEDNDDPVIEGISV